MKYSDLSQEMKEKIKGCATPEELLALAQAEGYELDDAQLESLSGGGKWNECEEDTVSGPY